MAITGATVTVATTATVVIAVGADYGSKTVVVQNIGSVDVFLGASNVTTAAYGYKLVAGAAITMNLIRSETLYAIVAATTSPLAVLASGGAT